MRGAVLGAALAGACWPAGADDSTAADYFPLRPGSWWAYEERDDRGRRLARETWTLDQRASIGGELRLRTASKRLDVRESVRRRLEAHEYLRLAADGVRKRFPAVAGSVVDVLLVKHPTLAATTWRDAQGICEVAARGAACEGPRGPLGDCLGVGMVRQEIELLPLFPGIGGVDEGGVVAQGVVGGGRSRLELVGYHVAP
jgi:hypothetical protein